MGNGNEKKKMTGVRNEPDTRLRVKERVTGVHQMKGGEKNRTVVLERGGGVVVKGKMQERGGAGKPGVSRGVGVATSGGQRGGLFVDTEGQGGSTADTEHTPKGDSKRELLERERCNARTAVNKTP